jgi:hypothetical protein
MRYFLRWTNNINRTAHEHTDSTGVCGNRNLAAAHTAPYAAFTSWQHVGQNSSKYSNIIAATKNWRCYKADSPTYTTTTNYYKLFCKINISCIKKCKKNSGVSVTAEKEVVIIIFNYALQSLRLIVQSGLDVPTSATRRHQRVSTQRQRVEPWAKNVQEFCLNTVLHVTFRDLLHAAKLRHGTDGFTSPAKEGVLRILYALKIRRLQPGANPRTWVPKASTLPLDHWSRWKICSYYQCFVLFMHLLADISLDNRYSTMTFKNVHNYKIQLHINHS